MPRMYSLIAMPHPFRSDRVQGLLEPGLTVAQAVVAAAQLSGRPIEDYADALVALDDRLVAKAEWRDTPVTGAIVVRAMPGDGFGSIFLQVLGFAAAAFVPPIGALTVAGVNVGQLLVRVGISVATSLIAQAIAPTPKALNSNNRADPVEARFSIQGVRNEARPYGVVPKVYGRLVNYHPPLAAAPWTEFAAGDQQFVRMLFCVGLAPLQCSNLRIGSTPIDEFKNLAYEVIADNTTATPTLFPGQVREEVLSIQLRQVAGYSIRATALDTDEAIVDIAFPNGMGRLTDRNVKFQINVSFDVLYRATGTSAWQSKPLEQGSGGVSIVGASFTVSGYSKAAVRRSVRIRFPSRGQWDVAVRRITVDDQSDNVGDNQSTTFEDSYWTGFKSLRNDPPINRTGLTLIALRAQATDQLNGIIDQLNLTVEALVPVWTGAAWQVAHSRNAAWAYADILRGPGNARPLGSERLDLDRLLEWANEGINFDGAFSERTSVWEGLQEVAGTANASPTVRDGLYSVVIDNPKTEVHQHFGARNVRNFGGSKILPPPVHALRVRFPNEQTLHQLDEMMVYADGYHAGTATRIEVLDLPWTTDAAAAWRRARRALASTALRPEIYTFETDLEHLTVERGSLVRLGHDVPMFGISSVRIAALVFSGADLVQLTLDAPIEMAGGGTYDLRVRLEGGASLSLPITTVAGTHRTVTLTTPIGPGQSRPAVGDLALYGGSVELLVRSVEPTGQLGALITCIDYAPAVFLADTGPIPPHSPQITFPPAVNRPAPAKPAITTVTSDESVLLPGPGGTYLARIVIGWTIPAISGTPPVDAVQVRWRETVSESDWSALTMPAITTFASVTPVAEGETYTIEVRTVSMAGLTSDWASITHTVIGKTTVPPDIETLYRQGARVIWPYPDPPIDLAGFRIRAHYGTATSWSDARPLHAGTLTIAEFDISAIVGSGTQTILAKAIDIAGNESLTAATLTINLGDVLVENVIYTQDEDGDTFPGARTACTVNDGVLEADVDVDALFWSGNDAAPFWSGNDAAPFWAGSTYQPMTYVATYEPQTDHLGDGIIKLVVTSTGTATIDYRLTDSPTFWTSDANPFWAGNDAALFWAAATTGAWQPWPGALGPLATTTERYEFRIRIAGGGIQGSISNLDILVDVADVLEQLDDIAISASGTRLPITKTYRAIDNVSLTRQDDGGSGHTAVVIDKDATNGPLVRVLNTSGTAVSGTVDATIQGH